ncbi:MAG: deoxyribonuclease V [Bacteroidota bacterium]
MQVNLHHAHPWQVSSAAAVAIQRDLAGKVRVEPLTGKIETIAGVDVSIRGKALQTAITVLALPSLEVVEEVTWQGTVQFPYIPGLLSFREMPAILPALEKLSVAPDVFMTDSQGLAHPRRFGLACHLGVLLDRPAFGVAKTRYIGRYAEPGIAKGSLSSLTDKGEIIGSVVRTRDKVKPVFVSLGHLMTLDDAIRLTLACTTRYKIPEPTRLAHKLSKRV